MERPLGRCVLNTYMRWLRCVHTIRDRLSRSIMPPDTKHSSIKKAGDPERTRSGTPAFFINGKLISGAQPYSVFEQAIEQELNN